MASTFSLDIIEAYAPRMARHSIAVLARYYRRAGEQAAERHGEGRKLYASIREAARIELVARGVEL